MTTIRFGGAALASGLERVVALLRRRREAGAALLDELAGRLGGAGRARIAAAPPALERLVAAQHTDSWSTTT